MKWRPWQAAPACCDLPTHWPELCSIWIRTCAWVGVGNKGPDPNGAVSSHAPSHACSYQYRYTPLLIAGVYFYSYPHTMTLTYPDKVRQEGVAG